MRLRFWIGLVAAIVVGAGAVVGSILTYHHDENEFHARQSTEDVAEELGLPVRTVTDVILLYELRRERESAGRAEPYLLRRTA